jgi:hypothetical protein
MRRAFLVSIAAVAFVAGSATFAQIEGSGRGVAPIDSGGAFEVSGIAVDIAGKDADTARYAGWRLAQRKAWVQLARRLGGNGAPVSDGTLDQLVSGIVVENEQIGPTRYVARLGVLFDRNRAGALLGVATDLDRSPPMLVMPVQWSAGVGQVLEQRSDWQIAWARFRTGNTSIDYIRPTGAGLDPLLLTIGQTRRPGRGWWRTIIDQYGAADILMPTVRLNRQWPGGPVIGQFEARYGPDNRLLGRFSLRVGSAQGLPQLLDAGVARLDGLYQRALREGLLSPDVALAPPPDPTVTPVPVEGEGIEGIIDDLNVPVAGTTTVTLQYDTPGASSVANTEALIRTMPGVRNAATTSLALGGVSLMRVELVGDSAIFIVDLQSRGYQVTGSGATFRISRPVAASGPAPGPGG